MTPVDDPSTSSLQMILNATPIPLIISRASDGEILYANEHLARLVNLEPKAAIGRSTLEFYCNPDDRQAVLGGLQRDGCIHNHELQIKTADGEAVWVLLSLVLTELDGEMVAVGGLYDVSDRKRAEVSLESERNFVSAVLDTVGALVAVFDTEGRIVRFNKACERLTGYAFDEVKGKPFWDLFLVPEEVEPVRRVFGELRAGQFPNEAENCWVTKSGDHRLIAWSNTALTDGSGAVEHIIGTGIDVTEHRQADRLLKDTESQLVESEKMASLGNLVAGIAHEINTPIGAISSMHDTLMRAVQKAKDALETHFPKECLESRELQTALKVISDANQVISTGTERVMKIVRSLRSFARLDEAELDRVDLHEAIDNTLTLVHHNLKERVEVVKHYGDVPPVVCYPSRLNQVFLNLLVNASQAIEGEGEIHISTRLEDGCVRAAVRDSGVGIPKENLRKVFEPGFTTKGVAVGTGLGLSICYQIMQDHQGRIEVESEVGKGSTFTVVFPYDLDEETPT